MMPTSSPENSSSLKRPDCQNKCAIVVDHFFLDETDFDQAILCIVLEERRNFRRKSMNLFGIIGFESLFFFIHRKYRKQIRLLQNRLTEVRRPNQQVASVHHLLAINYAILRDIKYNV